MGILPRADVQERVAAFRIVKRTLDKRTYTNCPTREPVSLQQ